VVTVVRSRMGGFIAVPTILSVILRDATQYFVVIFSVHILSVFFLFLAPVSSTWCVLKRCVVLIARLHF
jgi:hypothetical protein